MKSKAVYFFFVLLIPAFAGMTLAFAKTPPPKNTPKMDFKTCATSECHTDIYKIEHKHSPIKAGGCHLCHEPILGTHKFKLFENRQKMCTDCHEDMAKKNFGKTKGQFTLRTENHLFATHPLDTLLRPETKEKFEKTGLKLHQGKMECLTCHNHHGTNQTHLLRNSVHSFHKRLTPLVFSLIPHPHHAAYLYLSLLSFEKKIDETSPPPLTKNPRATSSIIF